MEKMREEFEEWFERDYHPDKTGPYVKDAMLLAWQASRAADQATEISELKRQRDELLAALGVAIPLIKQARLDWCDQNAESYDEDVVTPYDDIFYLPVLSLLENKGSAS